MASNNNAIGALSSGATFGQAPAKNNGLIGNTALGQFAESTISSIGEVFGNRPSPDVANFRAAHPIGGIASQLAGFAIPYVGWESAAARIPSVIKLGEMAAAKGGESVLARGALREAAKLAPFEAGRAAYAVGSGNSTLTEAAEESALSLGIGGAAGGLVAGIKSLPKVLDGIQGYAAENAPKQQQLRELYKTDMSELGPEDIAAVNKGKVDLGLAIRSEDGEGKFIRDGEGNTSKQENFVHDIGTSDATSSMNGLFREGKKLIRDPEHFQHDSHWLGVLEDAKIPRAGFEGNVATPRYVDFRDFDARGVKNREERVKRSLTKVDDSTYLAREADSGLYTMARRVKGPNGNDGVLLFKTDNPDLFNPGKAKWTDKVADASAWEENLQRQYGNSGLLDAGLGIMSSVNGASKKEAKNILEDSLRKGLSKFVSPRTFQLLDSGLGRAALTTMEAIFDTASSRAKRLTYGARAIDEERNKVSQFIVGNLKLQGTSVKSAADQVEDWDKVSQVLNDETPFEEVQKMHLKGEISTAAKDLLVLMKQIGDAVDEQEINPLQRLLGTNKYRARQGHYGVPRMRLGDHRVIISDENGQTVSVVGGKRAREARTTADNLIADAAKEGQTWVRSEPFLRDASLDGLLQDESMTAGNAEAAAMSSRLMRERLAKTSGSQNFQRRTNVSGFQTSWDKDSLVEAYGSHLDTKLRYAASMASRHAIDQFADKIKVLSGRHAFDVVERRLNDFEGNPGKIAQATNEAVDKVLGPVLGKGSATKIASTVNKTFMTMSLGAGNIAYPAINALTFVQTVMPHVAMVQHASPEMLGKYYDSVVMRARAGLQGGSTISPLKLAYQAAKQLGSSDRDWLKAVNRAANDGTVDPKLIEDYIGENSEKYLQFRKNMAAGPSGWAKSLYGMSALTMESGERISRAHGFANGFLLGKDFLKLEGEDLYQFAKKFTDNTMYRYATADRATLFAGPVGSMFGLFKNWMMHYTMWMIEHGRMAAQNPTSMNAWKPLLWQIAGTTAIGGVGAWPFAQLTDSFAKFTSNKDMMQLVYSNATLNGGNTTLADGIYYGLPAMLGLSLTAQSELPFHAPLSDAEFFAVPVQMQRINALFKAIGDSVDRFDATGNFNPLQSQSLSLEWAKAVAPKTIYHTMQVLTGDGGIRSGSTGEPLFKQLSLPQRVGHALGMQSTEIAKNMEINEKLWNEQNARKTYIANLGQEWKEAQMAGDYRAVQNVFARAAGLGIDPSRVVKSAQNRMHAEQQGSMDRSHSQQDIESYMQKMR